MIEAKRILVLAPHTDDGELGCGATMARFASEGKELFYAAFSRCEKSLPANLPPDTLRLECMRANEVLGVPESNLLFFDFEVREFSNARQAILESMVTINKDLKPDLVLLPASGDIHQDHQVIHLEALRAFRNSSLLGYELPWNQTQFHTQFFSRLMPAHLDKKIASLKAYQSQAHRNYMKEDFQRALARVRGVQCGNEYAEAFETYRMII